MRVRVPWPVNIDEIGLIWFVPFQFEWNATDLLNDKSNGAEMEIYAQNFMIFYCQLEVDVF